MKILLVYPSQFYTPAWSGKFFLSQTKSHLLYLASFLAKEHCVDVLDLENELGRPRTASEISIFRKKTAELLSSRSFDLAAISCWTSFNYLAAKMVAQVCRQVREGARIVVGGYHPSALPQDFFYKGSPFDFIVKGEGELALAAIAAMKRRFAAGPRVVAGSALDLRRQPCLEWRFPQAQRLVKSRIVTVYLSRGCPFCCSYCMEGAKRHRSWRSYTIEASMRTVEGAIGMFDPRIVVIGDACFGFDLLWRRAFLERLIAKKFDKIFWFQTRVDLMQRQDIDLFSRLNSNVEFGLESGSEEMLSLMAKTHNPKGYLASCRQVVHYANKKKLPHKISLIFNHPGETQDTYRQTLRFVASLGRGQREVSTNIVGQNFSLFPGSPAYARLGFFKKKYGTTVENAYWWHARRDQDALSCAVMPSEDIRKKQGGIDYWQQEVKELNESNFERMSSSTRILLWSWAREEGLLAAPGTPVRADQAR